MAICDIIEIRFNNYIVYSISPNSSSELNSIIVFYPLQSIGTILTAITTLGDGVLIESTTEVIKPMVTVSLFWIIDVQFIDNIIFAIFNQ